LSHTGSVTGAISTVRVYGSRVSYETIGGASPVGICGSGVLDIVSQALRNGIIDKTGRINEDYEEDYIEVARTERGEAVIFTQKDIREVQLAKSAIRSGIEILLKNFGCKIEDVDTVYLAGGFGNNLNIESAVSIGLIPSQLSDKIKPVGNSALGGAVKYLLDKNSGESLKTITGMTKYMDISADPEFNDLFIRNMLF
jgi:uncharacterized 2Fe-2S/4Fe-4S cluster protein (DUF4445 family)